MKTNADAIAIIIAFLLVMAISWAVSVGLIYLICLCFSWKFSWLIATGVWIILLIAKWIFGSNKD